ncbi:microcin C7 resistance protein [Rickettsia japonica]|uniref:Microcin C7 resistance protein n=4 Tax=spotted fever group TaxID=114277 RepID=G4KNB3_RICJY|nr:microcin C7 resistance protein [Rickettsia japonica YH]BAW82887.1 microcin C7 resistance protein [Rickettsia japonica]
MAGPRYDIIMKKIIFNKQRDFISIIAPASSCPDAQDKLKEAIKILALHGFKTLVDDKIFSGDELPFFAASKEERLRMFKEAMENEQVKIIWAFRGGYGCSEFVEDCFNIEQKGDKVLIGYSDITVLHLLLNNHYNIPTIHGSVLTSLLPPTNQDIMPIINVLKGEKSEIQLIPIKKISEENITGTITGGNLTVLTKLISTGLQIHSHSYASLCHSRRSGNPEKIILDPRFHGDDNKILLLEDVNEKAYAVHRNLVQLKNTGIFECIKAIIFGDFTKGDEFVEQAIKSFCLNHIQNIGTYKAAGIGHGEVNHPVIMNHEVIINSNVLSFTSPFEIAENK